MKRFISLLLALAMALSLVACGNGGSADTNQDANNADDQQTPPTAPPCARKCFAHMLTS